MIRLAKFVAECTRLSTRQSLCQIANGHIKVDGRPQFENIFINPQCVTVTFNHKELSPLTKRYYLLHKPINVLCAKKTLNETRKTVYDYCQDATVFAVGRLDYTTSGLIILTNDGSVSNAILAPSSNIAKEYHIKASKSCINAIYQNLPTVISSVARPYHINNWKILNSSCVSICLTEGKNREIRYMLAKCGVTDYMLHRVKIGNLSIGTLKSGEIRSLSHDQIIAGIYS